jgi:hypothetical protein
MTKDEILNKIRTSEGRHYPRVFKEVLGELKTTKRLARVVFALYQTK